MDRRMQYFSREDQAKAEIGVTTVSRTVACCAVLMFLGTVVSVLIVDQCWGGWRAWRLLASGGDVRERLHGFEHELEVESATARTISPVMDRMLAKGGVSGVDKVYLGREGWLFFEPDVRHVSGRGFLEATERRQIEAAR